MSFRNQVGTAFLGALFAFIAVQVALPGEARAQWVQNAVTTFTAAVSAPSFTATGTTGPNFTCTAASGQQCLRVNTGARIELNHPSGSPRYLFYDTGTASIRANGDFTANGSIAAATNINAGTNSNINILGTGQYAMPWTNSATIGAVTIDKAMGCGNIAAGASSVVITNSTISTSDVVIATLQANDTSALYIRSAIPTANTITIHTSAVATADTKVCFVAFQGT